MTNSGNTVRVRARVGGRASVYEANAWAQGFSSGLLEGNGVVQNTSANMTVLVGGTPTKPDVVIAENPNGYKIALDLVSQRPITITAPASNSRVSAIVAYTNDLSLASTDTSITGSPSSCGLIVVNGTTAASPVAPTDTQIRSAITNDGATGSQASYCVIATIKVSSNTTTITNSLIDINKATLAGSKVVKADNLDFTTLPGLVKADFGSGSSSVTERSLLKQVRAEGFNTNWQYMCIFSIGLLYTYGGAERVAFADLTVASPNMEITEPNRIRANGLQTTISYAVPFVPPAESLNINFNGSSSHSTISWENAVAYFIPIRPTS